jgi:hypothetical protein
MREINWKWWKKKILGWENQKRKRWREMDERGVGFLKLTIGVGTEFETQSKGLRSNFNLGSNPSCHFQKPESDFNVQIGIVLLPFFYIYLICLLKKICCYWLVLVLGFVNIGYLFWTFVWFGRSSFSPCWIYVLNWFIIKNFI